MRAAMLARGATDRAPTFHYHVDPAAGSDGTGSGSKSSPYASVAKAFTVAGAGQSVGILRGSVLRPAATLNVPAPNMRLGSYGIGAKPVLSGGAVVSGWASTAGAGGANLFTNGDFETWTNSTTPGTWVTSVGTGSTVTKDTSTFHGGAASANCAVGSSGSVNLSQTVTLTAGQTYTFQFFHKEDTGGKQIDFRLQIMGGTYNGYRLQTADLSWQNNNPGANFVQSNAVGWTAASVTFTMVAETQPVQFTISYFSGGPYHFWVDDATLLAGGAATPGSYAATLGTAPSFVTVTSGGVTTPLGLGGSASGLNTDEWFYGSGKLNVNLGGIDPGTVTVEASNKDVLTILNNVVGFTARNIEFRHGLDRTLRFGLGATYFTVDRCEFRYCSYVANSGVVSISEVGPGAGRVTRCVWDYCNNDGIWVYSAQNVQVDHNTLTNIGAVAGDVQSDGMQFENTFTTANTTAPNSNGLWVHHNTITMGSDTPKGCTLFSADVSVNATGTGVVEHNTFIGGNYGIAVGSSGLEVRYNTMLNQVSTFGGPLHVGSARGYIADVKIHHNLCVGSNRSGFIVQSGAAGNRSSWTVANNTFVNCGYSYIDIQSPFSGQVVNNICWGSAPSTAAFRYGGGIGGETTTVDYNLYPSNPGPGWYHNGTLYASLAAWQAASGFGGHASQSDPLLDANYQPGAGSPARNAGTAVPGITDGYLGSAPDLGYAEVG